VSNDTELDKNIEEQIMPEGYDDEVLNVASQWENLVSDFEDSNSTFNSHVTLSKDFETILLELESAITILEGDGKNFELKATISEKKDLLGELKNDLSEVKNKLCDIDILTKTPEYVKLYEEYIDIITAYQSRLNVAKDNFIENVARQEDFVKEHEQFNENYSKLKAWISRTVNELIEVQSITSELSNLQSKKVEYDTIEEAFESKKKCFSELVEQGEGLYEHTSMDGQITIREELNQLRTSWQQLATSMQQSGKELDSSLQELAEFTCLQEKLTRWLREIEYAMQEHTKLRPTLEEKKGQLESHEIIHKEINSRNSLVHSVCSKAEEIMEKRGDQSLMDYVTSIRALFKNIAIKSQDLIGKVRKLHYLETHDNTYKCSLFLMGVYRDLRTKYLCFVCLTLWYHNVIFE
jgi:nesprin-1